MKEGEIITGDQLRNEWQRVLSIYDLSIENGHKLRPMRFIIRHIIEKGYDKKLFPGTSMYTLLLSIPYGDRIDYSKTLRIEYDQISQLLEFTFKDRTEAASKNNDWRETCQATEGVTVLENFFSHNDSFSQGLNL